MRTHREHLNEALELSLRRDLGKVSGLNAKVALILTQTVGTMWCFWAFCVLSLVSLPAAVSSGDVIIIVAWTAQTFIQLVLLPAIIVGQNLQAVAADARSEKTFTDVETVIDRLDVHTAGGITDVLDAISALGADRPGGRTV